MATRIDPGTMWILRRDHEMASAIVKVMGMKLEVHIVHDGELRYTKTFDSGAEASAWAKEERGRMIAEEGWQDARPSDDSFRHASIILYQPDAELVRLGVDMREVGAYINDLAAAAKDVCATVTRPQAVDVVIAVRPDRRSRVWLVTEPSPSDLDVSALRDALQRVPPPEVRRGTLVFALNGAVANGVPRKPNGPNGVKRPIPEDWRDALSDANTLEEVLRRVWPEEPRSFVSKWLGK